MTLLKKRDAGSLKNRRSGFSMVELMVVIVIIAILAALILPAINASVLSARISEVQSDISSISNGVTAFKVRFKVEPPSSITLYEGSGGWTGDAVSRRTIKRLWPQFNFNLARDMDGDGATSGSFTLSGAECLVFFLGGRFDPASGALRGFSKNPANPFAMDNGTRDGPFFEFDGGYDVNAKKFTGRLVDSDSNNLPEYTDTLSTHLKPYVYYSSNGGTAYRVNDNTGLMSGPYFRDAALKQPYASDSFQIISPGPDGEYGRGGAIDSEDANGDGSLQTGEDTNGNGVLDTTRTSVLTGTRLVEQDNITSFGSGALSR